MIFEIILIKKIIYVWILTKIAIEKEICRISIFDPRASLMMTMPGAGPVIAVTVLAEMGDTSRFAKPEQLTAYAGLVPSHRNSADAVRTGGITKVRIPLAQERGRRGRTRGCPA